MSRFFRRHAVSVGISALALTLLTGSIAAAAPTAQVDRTAARTVQHAADQPPVSSAEAAKAEAALVPATAAGMPPTAQSFFAVVNANGTLARGFQAVSATSLGTGVYQVVFSHDITGSAFIGTIGLSGSVGISPAGQISVVGRFGLPNGVFVQTFNSAGVPANLGFHLAVLS